MNKIKFDGLMVTLASMEEVEKWSRGVVDNPDTRETEDQREI